MPIGLQLAMTAKTVSRAFNAALAESGGSLPTWLVLSSLQGEHWRTQQDLARAIRIEGPTLTRHLDALQRGGLVVRRTHPDDRRATQVELTDSGRALHAALLESVIAFNKQLRSGLTGRDVEQLRALLGQLEANARLADNLRA